MPPKGWKKDKQEKQESVVPVMETPEPVVMVAIEPAVVGDAGAGLYRDRSGPAMNNGLTEGRDNFGAITSEALRTVVHE